MRTTLSLAKPLTNALADRGVDATQDPGARPVRVLVDGEYVQTSAASPLTPGETLTLSGAEDGDGPAAPLRILARVAHSRYGQIYRTEPLPAPAPAAPDPQPGA